MPQAIVIIYLFIFGACIGSFLNVVVYRLPRGQSLVHPPSRCPHCEHRLAWFDNIPVFGWLFLSGKCRYCKAPISSRYPLVEAATGLLFAGFYVAIFVFHQGPFSAVYGDPVDLPAVTRMTGLGTDGPIFGLYLFTVAGLLAASLIDAELYLIPPAISWLIAGVALLVHAFVDRAAVPGAVSADGAQTAFSIGGTLGLIVSLILLRTGVLPMSFSQGEPPLEVEKLKRKPEEEELPDFTPAQVRAEIGKEMLFLLPPALLGGAALLLQMRTACFDPAARIDWLGGLFGSLFGGLIGAGVVWLTRIFGSLAFGKEAMGLGDVDLMFAVGAVVGPGAAVATFFIAPFFALPVGLAMLMLRSRRQLPFGPYLSMAAAVIMLFYFPVYDHYVRPTMIGLGNLLRMLI
jgi:leader peptidase (prepilin peptidase) / N-methyltransferase